MNLVNTAREVQESAYAPYSEYAVGAAIETAEGTVFTGCNIEIVNFSNTMHAEEVALSEAIKNGHRDLVRMAVCTSERDGAVPCGMCRQTLVEFCDADFMIITDHGDRTEEHLLGDLIPHAFSMENL